MSGSIEAKLDRLADYQAKRDYLNLEKKELLDQVIPPEIRQRIEEIEAEFSGRLEAVDANIAELEVDIRQDALQASVSTRGTFLAAVWCRGRVAWDNDALEHYAHTHPEILRYRKQSKPYITIRKI